MTDAAASRIDDDGLAGWEDALADIEGVVDLALDHPGALAGVVLGLRHGYATRRALLGDDAVGIAILPADEIAAVLDACAESLRARGQHLDALGHAFVALVTGLDACADGHPERERIDVLRRRAAAVLRAVGPDVAQERTEVVKDADIYGTRH